MTTKWSWMLLASYAVMKVLACCGIALAYINMGHVPPSAFPDDHTYSSTNSMYGNDWNEKYRNYSDETLFHGHYLNDSRTFVLVPSFVAELIAVVMIVAGICSRQIFSTTVSLYTSFGMFVVALAYILHHVPLPSWFHGETLHILMNDYVAVSCFLTSMSTLTVLQMILAMKELHTQKTGWPTLNFSNIFTLNTVLLVANVGLGTFTLLSIFSSYPVGGIRLIGTELISLLFNISIPLCYELHCRTASVFSLVVYSQALLSHLLGQSHNKLMKIFGMFSAVGYGVTALITSPGFVVLVIGPYRINPQITTLSIFMTLLSIFHTLACFLCPRFLNTTPDFIKALDYMTTGPVSETSHTLDGTNQNAHSPNFDKMSKNVQHLRKRMLAVRYPLFTLSVLVMSFVSIILNITIMMTPWGCSWVTFMRIAGNVAFINRVFAKVLAEVSSGIPVKEAGIQLLVNFLIETVLLTASLLGTDFYRWPDNELLAAVLTIPVIIYEFVCIKDNPAFKAAIRTLAASRSDVSEETESLQQKEQLPAVQEKEDMKV